MSPTSLIPSVLTTMLGAWVLPLTLVLDWAKQSFSLQQNTIQSNSTFTPSLNVSSCPGYELSGLQNTNTGLTAYLNLAGPACNAFGEDIANLSITVTYDTVSRLHVAIRDVANEQFTVPSDYISLPGPPTESFINSSDLAFNYESSPFAFWITRRSLPDATPLFDTRISSLPPAPIAPYNSADNETGFDGFPLVFEKQYLQLTSALPLDTNIYGLGEVISSSGFRRAISGNGSLQTMWARDIGDPIDENMYGSHSIYLDHRYDESTESSLTHGVFLFNPAGSDTFLATPPGSNVSLIQYRLLGGVFDYYFFSGPDPNTVISQYGQLIGLPTWQPAWGFGFHLCRWGYANVSETRDQVIAMREANIPLETMWNDIDLYHAYRDFTSDPVSFPGSEMRQFIEELASNNQHYIPIVDAAIAVTTNSSDFYDPYSRGIELNTFIKNPDGSEYIGQVWPGYTVFPDWFGNNTQGWWQEGLQNWSNQGILFSGIWLDMNEPSSFCTGSCGSGISEETLQNTSTPFLLPGAPGNLVTSYPECYDAEKYGPSGNMTINGESTYSCTESSTLSKRGVGASGETDVNLNSPPYAIHNGAGALSVNTVATNATNAGGYAELDVHNLFGLGEEIATHKALSNIYQGQRPFMISRSTFPSSGKWTGHWLGDNYSLWSYMYYSIQGILQFQIFQIPMVGADTCGFNDNTDEELCNRWMQLSAFAPFYRNHNTKGAISQEPYRWPSVAAASITAMAVRYSLLPYWYTLFANSSSLGLPPVRALFYEFTNEPELFAIDSQFLVGSSILVTPVLTPNVSTVEGIFPGRGNVTWRDWYTHEVVNASVGTNTTLSAPLGHINVHIRDSSALLIHANPQYTITQTRETDFTLLVSQAKNGYAFGTAYLDDGISYPPGPNTTLTFAVSEDQIVIDSKGAYTVEQKLQNVTVLGPASKPSSVNVGGKAIEGWSYNSTVQSLQLTNLGLNLNQGTTTISWK